MRNFLLAGCCIAVLMACDTQGTASSDGAEDAAVAETSETAEAPRFGTFGFDTAGMDTSVAPGDDFFAYANGVWAETTEIPSDRARYGVFDMLALEVEQQVQAIVTEAAERGGEAGSNEQMIGDLYASWMDADAIEARGLEPAQPYLDAIAAAEDFDAIAALMAQRDYHGWPLSEKRIYEAGVGLDGRAAGVNGATRKGNPRRP